MKIKISKISALHYYKLIGRSLLFLMTAFGYIMFRFKYYLSFWDWLERKPFILGFIWIIFVVEMILRFFPSSFESMGCQKVFGRNFKPTTLYTSCASGESGKEMPKLTTFKGTFISAAAWFALNGAIGAIYFAGWIDEGILLLICLAYSICDMICILFFCPFQTWFMKNKCCTTCRIYNWDFAMMFTPLVFIPNLYTWTLLGISLALLIYWEVTVRLHPERFMEKTNASLVCINCEEKLCHHKKQLQSFQKELFASIAAQNHQNNN